VIKIDKAGLSADVPLDAFMRRVSRIAEKIFNEAGEIEDPHWFVVKADGEVDVIVTPVFKFESPAGSYTNTVSLLHDLRKSFQERGVVRCASVAEAWRGSNTTLRPSLDPERREVVQVIAEDRDGATILAFRDIVRPAVGKPYLGKLELMDAPGPQSGRWTRMLSTPQEAGRRQAKEGRSKMSPRTKHDGNLIPQLIPEPELRADIPLEVFVREISRVAEMSFNEGVYAAYLLFVVTADSRVRVTIFTPGFLSPEEPAQWASDPDPDGYNEDLARQLRELTQENDIVRYAGISEARWCSIVPIFGTNPPIRPGRREIIEIVAVDRDGAAILAVREIVRPAVGKPYLGELELMDVDRSLSGPLDPHASTPNQPVN
jgi:hypothetical protein